MTESLAITPQAVLTPATAAADLSANSRSQPASSSDDSDALKSLDAARDKDRQDRVQLSQQAVTTMKNVAVESKAARKRLAKDKLEQLLKQLAMLMQLGGDPKTVARQAAMLAKQIAGAAKDFRESTAVDSPAAETTPAPSPTPSAASAAASNADQTNAESAGPTQAGAEAADTAPSAPAATTAELPVSPGPNPAAASQPANDRRPLSHDELLAARVAYGVQILDKVGVAGPGSPADDDRRLFQRVKMAMNVIKEMVRRGAESARHHGKPGDVAQAQQNQKDVAEADKEVDKAIKEIEKSAERDSGAIPEPPPELTAETTGAAS